MFADYICVFCRSVRWLQRILDVCQAYAESMYARLMQNRDYFQLQQNLLYGV